MVATRKSLPNVSVELPDENDKSIPIDLRRLAINGKGTLRGEAPKPREEKVYHWRGAVYAITDDTPQEWLDQEPEKWKTKDVKEKARSRERSESLAPPSIESRGTKRKSMSALEKRHVEEVQRATKRQRRSLPAVPTKPDCSARKRNRRSLPTKPVESPLKFDFSREGGENMLEHVELEKKTARKKGYTVDALPPLRSREDREREAAGYHVAANVREMGSLNTKIQKLKDKYDQLKAKAFLDKRRRLRKEQEQARGADVVERVDQILAATNETGSRYDHMHLDEDDRSQLDSQLNGISYEPTTGHATHDAASTSTRQESVPSTAVITSPDFTGASSDTTPPPEEPESEKPTSIDVTRLNTTTTDIMPSHNRGGQSLRWSLPRSKAPKLSDRLDDGERAESAIHKGRMNGESKQARRRRIRREMAILRGLPEDTSTE